MGLLMAQFLLDDALALGPFELPVQEELLGHGLEALKIINAIQIAATLLKFKVLIQRECNASGCSELKALLH